MNTTGTPIYYAMWDDFNIVVAPTPNAAAAAIRYRLIILFILHILLLLIILIYQNINNHYCYMVF
jgi:hypothetical protein